MKLNNPETESIEKIDRIDRRQFLRCMAGAGSACLGGILGIPVSAADGASERGVAEASYYQKLEEKKIRCELCPHECRVADLERGTCGVRENRGGTYYTLVYGNPCSWHIDPVEKKPLYHYYPGAKAFSIAAAGCNFVCRFCQNWEISQKRPEQVKSIDLPPRMVIRAARQNNCRTVAHTYTEPVVFYEYMLDCAIEGKRAGIPNVMISNGYIQEKPMRNLCRYLGAVKIDLKAFSEKFYKDMCSGTLQPVLDVLKILKDEDIWFEIVVLIIPTLNDSPAEIGRMTEWIVKELGPDVPLHFSRYYPTFMLKNIPPTPPATLHRARNIAMGNGLKYVYIGNILTEAANTYCPRCRKLLIERVGYVTDPVGLKKDRCKYCGEIVPGVF